MLFNPVDTTLLHFLQNPLRNIEYLESNCATLKWHTRLLHRLPVLRDFLSHDQLKSIIAHELANNLNAIKNSYKTDLQPNPELIGKDNYELYTTTLGKYFNVKIPARYFRKATLNLKKSLSFYREATLFTKLEYTCNRVTENLNLDESYFFSTLTHQQLWTTYYLSETYFLLTQNLLQAKYRRGKILISVTPALLPSLRQRWLAETSEFHSNMTDRFYLQNISHSLIEGRPLSLQDKENITDYILDKCLSIHVNFISPALEKNTRYQYLRDVVFIAAYLEMRALQGHRTTQSSAFSAYVNPASTALMASALASEQLPMVDSPQSFIAVRGNDYIRGALNFKYGLKKLVGFLLGDSKDPENSHDVKGLLGNNFEQEHMIDYIRNIKGQRFKVHPGFKAGNNAKIKKYDIDLILEDTTHNCFYFIQAKYRLSAQPTFLGEQYEILQKSDFKKGYALQLITLKENLGDSSIRDKLKGLGLSAATEKNSHFILIHNLPFLNFYNFQGVCFYEWNLFRNLLKNGKISISHNFNIREEHTLNDEQLKDPERIIDAYFGDTASGQQNQFNYALYRDTQVSYRVGNLNILSDVI
ncbi:hypothetical protein [Pseudomonas sp. RIT288]|jgi:hypothetical protein|uniref:hypothetical protein n=1 Tax=Pseudomonas sp. RIT288 TaxID=1470589 RepID=UPI00044AD4E3|nr:hypothetical protein [Pseudomonas sp. RIT288]EZP26317.1 hypothetical protein BW33_04735 [Pseudomonas sp. RIT288]